MNKDFKSKLEIQIKSDEGYTTVENEEGKKETLHYYDACTQLFWKNKRVVAKIVRAKLPEIRYMGDDEEISQIKVRAIADLGEWLGIHVKNYYQATLTQKIILYFQPWIKHSNVKMKIYKDVYFIYDLL